MIKFDMQKAQDTMLKYFHANGESMSALELAKWQCDEDYAELARTRELLRVQCNHSQDLLEEIGRLRLVISRCKEQRDMYAKGNRSSDEEDAENAALDKIQRG